MAQIRLTRKLAKDFKVEELHMPEKTHHPMDDWFFDYLYVRRKKIAVITHARSLFTFFIPYSEAGGAKNLVSYFSAQLTEILSGSISPAVILEIRELFLMPPYFCKTIDKRVLGHMNDFKRMISFYDEDQCVMDWKSLGSHANDTPINYSDKCSCPRKVFHQIISNELP